MVDVKKRASRIKKCIKSAPRVFKKKYWALKYGRKLAPKKQDVIYVDPLEIARMVTGHRPFSSRDATIADGDWDQKTVDVRFCSERQLRNRIDYAGVAPLENYEFFVSARDHFLKGIPWEQTSFYAYKEKQKEQGYYAPHKIKKRLEWFDELYHDVKNNGYKSQVKNHAAYSEIASAASNEVTVAIARDGEILFLDGRHRLVVAQLCGVDAIPVRVAARHRNWQLKRVAAIRGEGEKTSSILWSVVSAHPDVRSLF